MKHPLRRLYNLRGQVDERAFRERMQPVGHKTQSMPNYGA